MRGHHAIYCAVLHIRSIPRTNVMKVCDKFSHSVKHDVHMMKVNHIMAIRTYSKIKEVEIHYGPIKQSHI